MTRSTPAALERSGAEGTSSPEVPSSLRHPSHNAARAALAWRPPVPSRPDATRLTGCPAGCPLDRHQCGAGEPIRTSCHACGSLDLAARESLADCSTVCPMRTEAVA